MVVFALVADPVPSPEWSSLPVVGAVSPVVRAPDDLLDVAPVVLSEADSEERDEVADGAELDGFAVDEDPDDDAGDTDETDDEAGAEDAAADDAGADELGADELGADAAPLIGSVTCALGGAALGPAGLLCVAGDGLDTSEAGELPQAVSTSAAAASAAPVAASRRRDPVRAALPGWGRSGRAGAEAERERACIGPTVPNKPAGARSTRRGGAHQ